jgi:hypothetical protein
VVPAELVVVAVPVQPLPTPLNFVFTAVMAMPDAVSLGENFPFPEMLHSRVPLAGGWGMALTTAESTTVRSVVDKRQTADTPSILRNMISPDRPSEIGRWNADRFAPPDYAAFTISARAPFTPAVTLLRRSDNSSNNFRRRRRR